MAQLIMEGNNYDHADRNSLNNRRYNLRLSTYTENARNRSKFKNNSSGFIGVTEYNKRNTIRWRSAIKINGKTKYLGSFTDKEDAIRARLEAEKEYYGEFAPQRHLFKEYGIEDDFSKEE